MWFWVIAMALGVGGADFDFIIQKSLSYNLKNSKIGVSVPTSTMVPTVGRYRE